MSGGEPADIREQNDLLLMAYGSMSPVARRLSMPSTAAAGGLCPRPLARPLRMHRASHITVCHCEGLSLSAPSSTVSSTAHLAVDDIREQNHPDLAPRAYMYGKHAARCAPWRLTHDRHTADRHLVLLPPLPPLLLPTAR